MRGFFYSWSSQPTKIACQFGSNTTIIDYDNALKCYKSFPLEKFEVENTIQSLKSISNLYIHSASITNIPEFGLKVNIRDSLSEFGKISYSNQWEFHTKITKFYNSLQDFNYNFESTCFNKFTFVQPFPLISTSNNYGFKTLKIYNKEVHEPNIKNFWAKLGFDLEKYYGSKVLKIENKDPWEYLNNYVKKHIGISYDNNAKFNLALVRAIQKGGQFGINYGAFMSTNLTPSKPNITFVLKLTSGQIHKITVPYLVKLPDNYNYKLNFKSQFCNYEYDWEKESKLPSTMNKIDKVISKFDTYNDVEILFQGKYTSLNEFQNKYTVLKIYSFSVDNDKESLFELNKIVEIINMKPYSKLILDFSSTLGSDLCFAKEILSNFLPNSNIRILSDILNNGLWRSLLKTETKNNNFFSDEILNTDMNSVFHYHRGSIEDVRTTTRFEESCSNVSKGLKLKSKVTPNNTIIITDSICFQACSILVKSFQKHHVPTIVISSVNSKSISAASMPSLRTFSSTQLEDMLHRSDLRNHYLAPPLLRNAVRHRFTYQEEYLITSTERNLHSNKPLQFQHFPATFKLPMTYDLLDWAKRWEIIMKRFH